MTWLIYTKLFISDKICGSHLQFVCLSLQLPLPKFLMIREALLALVEGIRSCRRWRLPANVLHPHLSFWRHLLRFAIIIFIKNRRQPWLFWRNCWCRLFRFCCSKFDRYGVGFLRHLTAHAKAYFGDFARRWWVC